MPIYCLFSQPNLIPSPAFWEGANVSRCAAELQISRGSACSCDNATHHLSRSPGWSKRSSSDTEIKAWPYTLEILFGSLQPLDKIRRINCKLKKGIMEKSYRHTMDHEAQMDLLNHIRITLFRVTQGHLIRQEWPQNVAILMWFLYLRKTSKCTELGKKWDSKGILQFFYSTRQHEGNSNSKIL